MTSAAPPAEPSKRSPRLALIIAGVVLLCTLGLCGGAGMLVAVGAADILDCPDEQDLTPAVSGVQTDAGRIRAVLPALGELSDPHWRLRDARPRTCPDLGPMDVFYEGFAVLAAERTTELRAVRSWEPGAAPEVPPELVPFAPPAAAWHRSAAFDAETRAAIWLDPASRTVYFSYLRG